MAEERDIKYINRDFGDFKEQLTEFAKNYFPDTYNDFSPTSPGVMFIEMAAYVGDVLSFYQDTQLQETFLQYAKNPGNLYNMAYMLGYRPKVTTVSEVELEVSQRVAASGSNYAPDFNQALTVNANAQISSGNEKFIIDKKIDFSYSSSYDPTDITIYSLSNGYPAEFLLKKKVKAFSGEIKTSTQTFTSAEKFKTITIDDENIIGVLDITDSGANEWYEVPFLGQDTIVVETANTDSDSNQVPYLASLQRVPRRFTTRFNSQGQLTIQFGAGISGNDDSTFLPDPLNVGAGTNQGITRTDYAYDPSNFLYSRSYGLAPSSTTLTIRYLVGGGVSANVPANTVQTESSVTSTATDTTYQGTLTFNNPKAATGGRDGDTVEEIRENTFRAFNEQGRAVTLQDYAVRALSLPSTLGSISKAHVMQDQLVSPNSSRDSILDSNPLALSMYVLAYDVNKNLTLATDNLKQNLKQYLAQYMVLTDAVTIKDAFIVNIGVKFDILTRPNYNGRDVLLNCTNKLKEFFNISNWAINEPINLAQVSTLLDRVKGVQTVQKLEITNKVGGNYSQYSYDIKGATKGNVVYPSYDPMVFEVKFPDQDIQGRVTTL
jgi:hypothetical protein